MRPLLIVLLSILQISCSEKFEIVDHSNFNNKILNYKTILTKEQIVDSYFSYFGIETPAMMRIEEHQFEDGKIQLTFKEHNIQEDNSVKSKKVTITIKKNSKNWRVLEIKKVEL